MLLGAVQGLTEFLPISSDGHLIVFAQFFPSAIHGRDALGFDVLLHGGSLLALLLLYAATWWRLVLSPFRGDRSGMRLLFLLCVTAVPGAIAGLLLEDVIALQLRTLPAAALGFIVTALALIVGERMGKHHRHDRDRHGLSIGRALLLGGAQAVAILPGVSRSGLTISTGRFLGVARREAVDVSFLMAVPIIAGAVGKTVFDAWQGSIVFPPLAISLTGFATSFIVSAAAIAVLRSFVRSYSVAWFACYLLPLALFLLYHHSGLQGIIEDPHALSFLIHRYGALIIFFVCMIEVIPPISFVSPGILLLLMAGSRAGSSGTLLLFIAAASSGIILGNMLLFRLGYYFGRDLAHRVHLSQERLHLVEAMMRRFGPLNVFFGQFIGIVRPAVAFVAGAARMPVARYYPWMVASGILWGTAYIGAGFLLGRNVGWISSVLIGVGILVYILGLLTLGAQVRALRADRTT